MAVRTILYNFESNSFKQIFQHYPLLINVQQALIKSVMGAKSALEQTSRHPNFLVGTLRSLVQKGGAPLQHPKRLLYCDKTVLWLP